VAIEHTINAIDAFHRHNVRVTLEENIKFAHANGDITEPQAAALRKEFGSWDLNYGTGAERGCRDEQPDGPYELQRLA